MYKNRKNVEHKKQHDLFCKFKKKRNFWFFCLIMVFSLIERLILIIVWCLQVDDQMKLLQHSWSDMLVLDHLHQRLHNNLPDETTLHNGQKFDLLCLGLLGVPSLADLFNDLSTKLQDLKFDLPEYICMKFLMLLNHGKNPSLIKHIFNLRNRSKKDKFATIKVSAFFWVPKDKIWTSGQT